MARATFGGTAADTVARRVKVLGHDVDDYEAATLTVWSAQTGGTQYTDLLVNGAASNSVPVDSTGQVPEFQGPDGVTVVWVSAGGARVKMLPAEGPTDTSVAGYVNDSASSTRTALVTLKNAAYDDFTGMADGALPASHLTRSGHGITLFNLGGTDYTLSGGALVHTTTAGTTAAYLGVKVPTQVRRLHAEVKWTDATQATDELLALIVSGSQFTKAGFADAGAHVLIYRDHWTYQTYQAGVGPTTVDSGTFKPLPFGQWNRFALTWDGFQPTLWFPDGTSHAIASSATITAGWGPHATIESYSPGNVNPVAVRAFYASSEVSLPTTATISGAGRHAKTPTTASTSITGSFTVVDTLTITVPQSRLLSVVAYEYVDTGGATGNVYSQVDVGGNGTSTQYQLLSSGVAVNRSMPIIAVLDLGDFTPGTTQTLNIRLLSDATGAIHRLNASEHRRQIIIATPVGAATF